MIRKSLVPFIAALVLCSSASAAPIKPGCDVTTYSGAVCAVRGYIDGLPALGAAGQRVQCYYASRRVGTYTQHHGRLRPHTIIEDPRWSCHAEVAGAFVVYQMAPTGRPEIWQTLSITLSR